MENHAENSEFTPISNKFPVRAEVEDNTYGTILWVDKAYSKDSLIYKDRTYFLWSRMGSTYDVFIPELDWREEDDKT